jgi:hypothetical protein
MVEIKGKPTGAVPMFVISKCTFGSTFGGAITAVHSGPCRRVTVAIRLLEPCRFIEVIHVSTTNPLPSLGQS